MASREPEPLEDRAYFSISVDDDGYVHLEQSVGDPPIYTPTEARDIAADIRSAADRAEQSE